MTYRDIAGRLAQEQSLRHYEMEEAPGEDTVRREVKHRSSLDTALSGKPVISIEFDPQRPEDLGHKTLSSDQWQVACPRGQKDGYSLLDFARSLN